MFGNRKVSEQFLKISKEHTLIQEHLHSMNRLARDHFQASGLPEWASLLPVLNRDIRDHFQVEEQILFPAALTCMPELDNFDRILQLQKEHGYFERDFEFLIKWIGSDPVPWDEAHRTFILTLIQSLEKHARTEMEAVYRPMDQNRHCIRLLKGAVIPE